MQLRTLTLLCFIALSSISYAQTFTCGAITHSGTGEEIFFTFSDFICDDMGTDDPNDDVLRFTVTSANGNSSQALTGFPVGQDPFIIDADPFDDTNLDTPGEVQFWFGNSAFTVIIGAPSPGCAPLDLTLTYSSSGTPPCSPESIVIDAAVAAVPTLSQWGIIILFTLMLIFSVTAIKQSSLGTEKSAQV